MSYRKFKADNLFTGKELLGPDAILVTDESGFVLDILPASEAGEGVQTLSGILSPGFINCHCHLELSHMRGRIPRQTRLVDFVFAIVNDRHFPEEQVLDAIAKAEAEMISNGIVAVGDICNNTLTLAQKKQNNLAYYNFIEVSGWLPAVAEKRYTQSLENLKAFANLQSSVLPNAYSLSPHAPYSVSEALWQLLVPGFKNKTVTIHNQETDFEDSLFEKGEGDFNRMYAKMQIDNSAFVPTGKSSLQTYLPYLKEAGQVLLVHNTFTKEADINFAGEHHASVNWCICINANLYIENAVPPIELLRKKQCPIVIGTDSLASNQGLDILGEMKSIHHHFPQIPLDELLTWATSNGAKALQLDNLFRQF